MRKFRRDRIEAFMKPLSVIGRGSDRRPDEAEGIVEVGPLPGAPIVEVRAPWDLRPREVGREDWERDFLWGTAMDILWVWVGDG
tara:strand:- start:168 stop:419 length:252 start_codon:yes stop_codon:yes gene_type:complete